MRSKTCLLVCGLLFVLFAIVSCRTPAAVDETTESEAAGVEVDADEPSIAAVPVEPDPAEEPPEPEEPAEPVEPEEPIIDPEIFGEIWLSEPVDIETLALVPTFSWRYEEPPAEPEPEPNDTDEAGAGGGDDEPADTEPAIHALPVEFEIEVVNSDGDRVVAAGVDSPSYRPDGEAFAVDSYRWRVRPARGAVRGEWSEVASFAVVETVSVRMPFFPGGTTFENPPLIAWQRVAGAESYAVEIRRGDGQDPSGQDPSGRVVFETEQSDTAITLQSPMATVPHTVRVAAIGPRGHAGWNDAVEFVPGTLGVTFRTVLEPGRTARVVMGVADGRPDERPVRTLEFGRPYELATYPLTNSQATRLLNWMIRVGWARIEDGDVRGAGDDRLYLGIAELEYGEQFGVTVQGDTVAVRAGREQHPVVGVTWWGAVRMADALSIATGLTPAYGAVAARRGDVSPSPSNPAPSNPRPEDFLDWDRGSDGFRLPTEVEWEFAARGPDGNRYPWGNTFATNRVNFYRSGDPFEAVEPPFTQRGGPTTPVGFFNGSNRAGYATGSNASPFGLFDMLGNVWEWTWDWYRSDTYRITDSIDGPELPEVIEFEGYGRVVRGTAWNTRLADVRASARGRFPPGVSSYSLGVRFARSVPPLEPAEPAEPTADSREED